MDETILAIVRFRCTSLGDEMKVLLQLDCSFHILLENSWLISKELILRQNICFDTPPKRGSLKSIETSQRDLIFRVFTPFPDQKNNFLVHIKLNFTWNDFTSTEFLLIILDFSLEFS